MTKFLVFQHLPHEGLGSFEPVFLQAGIDVQIIPTPKHDLTTMTLEGSNSIDALVVMGGPMSANDDDQLPFIREELRLIEAAVKQKIPILGVCLGSQMLAKVLGSKVYPGKKKEIGWYPLQVQPAGGKDPLMKKFPTTTLMFQWHGETFDLPKNSELLASSELYPHQAFRFENSYGFQFHSEMTLEMIQDWVEHGKKEMEGAELPHSAGELLQQSEKFIGALKSMAQGVAQGFVDSIKKESEKL